MRRFLILLAMLPAATLGAQPSRPVVGAPAPEPGFDRRLDGGAAPKLADLRGRAVVLEFWATWCVPCIQAFPHFNLLAEQFDSSRVAFLAVTDEDSATAASLLARRPLAFIHLLDADGSAKRAYAVPGIPTTALIYPDGRLAGTLPAALLDRGLVDALIAGRPISTPARPALDTASLGFDPMARMLAFRARFEARPDSVAVSIRRNRSGERAGRFSSVLPQGYLEGSNMELARLVAILLDSTVHRPVQPPPPPRPPGTPPPPPPPPPSDFPWGANRRVHLPDSLREMRVDVHLSVPPGHGVTFGEVLERAVEDGFGVEVALRDVPDTMYVLRRDPARLLSLSLSQTTRRGSSSRGGTFRGSGEPVASLAAVLSQLTRHPVRDETGLMERYDWLVELTPPVEGPEGARRLAEALGFVLVPELVPQRRLVVTPRRP